MKHRITAAVSATTLLAGTFLVATAGPAQADIGFIHVVQFNSAPVSTQNYLVANLLLPETIVDRVTSGATTAVITNRTNESISVVNHSTTVIPPGRTMTINDAGDAFITIDVPAGL